MSELCGHQWGNCDPQNPVAFGKPSTTPHFCKGGARHASKLHVCQSCGEVGHRIMPTRLSAAGRQYQRLVDAADRDRKAQEAAAG